MGAKKKKIVIPRHILKNVAEGIKFLDIVVGRKEWLSRMDMSDFDIVSFGTCVAGNVFKNGMDGYDAFVAAMKNLHVDDIDGVKFGFYTDDNDEWPFLQDVWVSEIKRLKKAVKVK